MTLGTPPAEPDSSGQPDPAAPPEPFPAGPPPARVPPQWYPAGPPPAQFPPGQFPAAQYPAAQYPAAQYPAAQYPAAQYPGAGYPPAPYPGDQFPDPGYPAAAPAAGPLAGPAVPASPARRRRWPTVAGVALAVISLAVAVVAGAAAHATLTRTPTAAERAAAAATAIARRWQTWPAGRIFPATLGYSTSLLTNEQATRIGISPASGCEAALSVTAGQALRRDGCRAGLRATYVDQLQGIVYTIGVLAFPDSRHAASFSAGLAARGARFRALRPLAVPGTAGARFRAAAAQLGTVRRGGPFVILTVAGYADGEPRGGQRRLSVFAPATQLAAQIARPLTAPVTVNCASPQWSC